MSMKEPNGLVFVLGIGFFNDRYRANLNEDEMLLHLTSWIDYRKKTTIRLIVKI